MTRAHVSSRVRLPPFQALLDEHGRDVHRFLVATVGPTDADDCYQETWISALRAYPRLRHDSNLRGWLFTVAHRKALDHLRAAGRRPLPVAEVVATAAESAPGPAALDGRPELWAQVRELPSKQRTAVALRFIVDASHAEIAQMMGTSEDAARRNVHEGLKRLRMEYQSVEA
jgi:RNA polymerase sigma factor (sigma-70 family)